MLSVQNVFKRYGKTVALQNVSFEIGEGEIVGFLGPNGAGKTTLIRILTRYLAPTSGTISISSSLNIGYLPESVPLYTDMRVAEFLTFRGRLKGVLRKDIKQRVNFVLGQCCLEDVSSKIIGQLSKGYRQRVGLAEAIVHDPEFLILDEPTVGLDPNQIVATRKLIAQLAKTRTIFISSHILSEIEQLCDRVIIINEGTIVADQSVEELRKEKGSLEEAFINLTVTG